MLVVDKLNNCIKISNLSIEEGAPSSAYVLVPIKYNTIDIDYKENNMERSAPTSSRRKNIGYYPPLKLII
jgi:type VI protein secretion system component Hcp